ncbi:MAG TPA: CocE/NonD family hydrolase [Solirubrobacteraceae bacterium]|jgi:hypothetical protein|nr:CocE/NonD family hydrolase [Solirubrobacteraceae bacterium]
MMFTARRTRATIGVLVSALAAVAVLAFAAPAGAWTPEAATYGLGTAQYTVTAPDGTPLHVQVVYPTDPKTGKPAPGPFPVLLSQSPYVSSVSANEPLGTVGDLDIGAIAGNDPYLVERGYIGVTMDIRGTGGSGGQWNLLQPQEAQDGLTVVHWAATQLPDSDGKVGLVGASYLGITQFPVAADAGPNSPIKAIFPIIAANDVYRDEVSAGGLVSAEFNLPYLLAIGAGVNTIAPIASPGADTPQVVADHVSGLLDQSVPLLLSIATGGTDAYDGPFWQERDPINDLQKIVANGIPAFLVGGWFDLFQRGEPLNYSGFQNAYDGRPVLGPMTATQPVTGRYQLLQGPWYHVTIGAGLDYHGLDLDGVELAWFDRWLKDIPTGIDQTQNPFHAYDLGSDQWVEASHFPFPQATPTRYYLGAGGSLSTSAPTASSGADPLLWTGVSLQCANSLEQWAAGAGVLGLSFLGLTDPCTQNATLSQIGPGTENYTTAPFSKAETLAGPIGATLYASANTKDTEWVVTVSDVAPNGESRSLTEGVLDGSLRALDRGDTWDAPDGMPILPYHPFTQASAQPVAPGQVTRYDVEIFTTFDTIEPGHRLRITVSTSETPHIIPTLTELTNLVGGAYQLQRNASAPSSLELPLAPAGSFPAATGGPLEAQSPSQGVAGNSVTAPACVGRRTVTIHPAPAHLAAIKTVSATVNGRRAKVRRSGRDGVVVSLAGRPRETVTVVLRGTLRNGRRFEAKRRVRTCAPKATTPHR